MGFEEQLRRRRTETPLDSAWDASIFTEFDPVVQSASVDTTDAVRVGAALFDPGRIRWATGTRLYSRPGYQEATPEDDDLIMGIGFSPDGVERLTMQARSEWVPWPDGVETIAAFGMSEYDERIYLLEDGRWAITSTWGRFAQSGATPPAGLLDSFAKSLIEAEAGR